MGNTKSSDNAAVVAELEKYCPILVMSQKSKTCLWDLHTCKKPRLESKCEGLFSADKIWRAPVSRPDQVLYRGLIRGSKKQYSLRLCRVAQYTFEGTMFEGLPSSGMKEVAKVYVLCDK